MFLERRDKDANYYALLQKRTLDMLQQLSGKVWTDFNTHDPGVTIADVFNYALYELNYIFQFPFESFLNIKQNGSRPDYLKKDLFGVKDIFGDSIITVSDYEKLIKDNINDVRECRISVDDDMLYKIEIEVKDGDGQEIEDKVTALYHANRNLCENLGKVIIVDMLSSSESDAESFRPEISALGGKKENYPAVPQDYYSIQNHFPECYGLSERGISNSASKEYKAQVMQLKAYLLIFDYLLADAGIQAKNIGRLLSLSGKLPDIEIPVVNIRDIKKLIDDEKADSRPVHSDKFWNVQKSRFLDVLDSIYGENTKSLFMGLDIEEQNERRAGIIPLLPEFNRNRFRSFNILDTKDKIPAIKQMIGLIVGLDIKKEISISNIFARYRLHLIEDKIFYIRYKQRISVDVSDYPSNQALEKIPLLDILYEDSRYEELYSRINLLWHNILYQSFLIYGSDISNYRIIDKWEKGYLLVFKIPKEKGWIVVGQFYEKELLIETANLFCRFIEQLSAKSQNFYLLEHLLLKSMKRKSLDYNKLSIIFPCWAKAFNRKKYQEKISDRLPVHIRIEFIALPMHRMISFENLYYKWRVALSEKDKIQTEKLSEQLLNVLDYN